MQTFNFYLVICLTFVFPPNKGLLYGFALFIVIAGGYVKRLQRFVCARYHPEREKVRKQKIHSFFFFLSKVFVNYLLCWSPRDLLSACNIVSIKKIVSWKRNTRLFSVCFYYEFIKNINLVLKVSVY